MTIIDRYLLRQYTHVLLICFCSLVGLYAVIDALGHMDQFARQADVADQNVLVVMTRYYAFQSLGFFDRTSGILAMMAAMFSIAWLKRHNELTALLAAGVSLFRAATPVLVASGLIALLAAANREAVLPSVRSHLLRDTKDLVGTSHRPMTPWFDPTTGTVLGGASTLARDRKIIQPFLILPTDASRVVNRITAESAQYVPANNQHPAGFILEGIESGKELLNRSSLVVNDQPVIQTPVDLPWLDANKLFFPTEAEFDQLAAGPKWRHFASTAELIRFVSRPAGNAPAEAHVALHSRFIRPILDMSLVVIGLPLILSRRDRSPFLAVGLAMALVACYLLVVLISEFLGTSGWISPSLAAWLPLFIFIPLAVASSGVFRR